jgi:oxygen-independent coproporphyrinogen-3 oxidase
MDNNAGLYFHIPFCKNKCPYCDFFSVKYNAECANKYADKLVGEMKKYDGIFDTVYFGGGTPSILESDLICRILSEARAAFTILPESEITIECNPSKNLYDYFKAYAKSGINRISLGMQSAVDSERFALGSRQKRGCRGNRRRKKCGH